MSHEKAIKKCQNKIKELFEGIEYYRALLDERKRIFMTKAISLLRKDFPHSKYSLDFECTHILEFYQSASIQPEPESKLEYDTVFNKDGIIIKIYLRTKNSKFNENESDIIATISKQLTNLYYSDEFDPKQDQIESKE